MRSLAGHAVRVGMAFGVSQACLVLGAVTAALSLAGCSSEPPVQEAVAQLQAMGVRVNVDVGEYSIDARNLPDFTDDEIKLIAEVPNVTSVTMQNVSITDAGLLALEPLTRLSRLILNETDITGQGLAQLPRKRGITNLGLKGTKLTDSDLEVLSEFTNLSRLDVSETEISDAGLKHLEGLNLRMLNVTGTKVTEDGAASFKEAVPKVDLVR